MLLNDSVYRVNFLPDKNTVDVIGLGINGLDLPHQGTYHKDNMPDWMQDKLHALAVLRVPPPEANVEGVGKRISETIFWVYPD